MDLKTPDGSASQNVHLLETAIVPIQRPNRTANRAQGKAPSLGDNVGTKQKTPPAALTKRSMSNRVFRTSVTKLEVRILI